MTCMTLLQIKAQSSIRPQSITGKSRLRQRRAITRRPGGNRYEQGRVLNALQGSAAIFMRERDSRDYPVLENMRLQNAFWAWERATWVVLAIILLIALTGLFAHGPLSERTVGDAGLSLTYERFQRVTALARLTARISVSSGDEASLTLSPAFADNFQISDIEPRPLRSTAGPGGLELVFQAPAAGELSLVIWAHPRSFGYFDLSAAASREGRVAFSILVYP
jgi:hypothetical protein